MCVFTNIHVNIEIYKLTVLREKQKTITLSPQERCWCFLPVSLHMYVSPRRAQQSLMCTDTPNSGHMVHDK